MRKRRCIRRRSPLIQVHHQPGKNQCRRANTGTGSIYLLETRTKTDGQPSPLLLLFSAFIIVITPTSRSLVGVFPLCRFGSNAKKSQEFESSRARYLQGLCFQRGMGHSYTNISVPCRCSLKKSQCLHLCTPPDSYLFIEYCYRPHWSAVQRIIIVLILVTLLVSVIRDS